MPTVVSVTARSGLANASLLVTILKRFAACPGDTPRRDTLEEIRAWPDRTPEGVSGRAMGCRLQRGGDPGHRTSLVGVDAHSLIAVWSRSPPHFSLNGRLTTLRRIFDAGSQHPG